MINKIYSMLGLCMKAGKLTVGMDVCVENIKNKKAFLIILAEDASNNTKEKVQNIANEYNVKCVCYGNIEELSRAIGNFNKAIFAVLDDGFGKKILQLINESKGAMK